MIQKIKFLNDDVELFCLLSAYTKKYYVYATGWLDSSGFWETETKEDQISAIKNIYGSFPYLKTVVNNGNDELTIIMRGWILIEFDTLQEMQDVYLNIVGDDGNYYPHNTNLYDGTCRTYALTIYNGLAHNENT